jgi:ankyrin repeat protein
MEHNDLFDAVKAGDLNEVENQLNLGADPNFLDEQGWTALNYAAGRGDFAIVKLLLVRGADVFKTGRDNRTPYMISLAAGRGDVAKFIREVEDSADAERAKSLRPPRQYCKAYLLGDLRRFPGWSEVRINWKGSNDPKGSDQAEFADDRVVFIHQDFTVTESMRHNENVIFNQFSPEWKEFCATTLEFKVLDDLDLIAATAAAARAAQ